MIVCRNCLTEPVVPPHHSYCSVRCMKARSGRQRRQILSEFRSSIAASGYDIAARALFERAGQEMLAADPRAWHYRLILDLVDGHPTRTPINLEIPSSRACRSVTFPEPNRRSHLDTNGLRRPGDFFTLRQPFEWPVVPVAAYYRVQLLGVCDKGEPLPLQPLRDGQPELRVRLPPSPLGDRWRYASWGSPDIPAHRARQIEKRRQKKELCKISDLVAESVSDA